MFDHFNNVHMKVSTAGGLLTIILANISGQDVLRTVILAGVGATVSYLMSFALKRLLKKWDR